MSNFYHTRRAKSRFENTRGKFNTKKRILSSSQSSMRSRWKSGNDRNGTSQAYGSLEGKCTSKSSLGSSISTEVLAALRAAESEKTRRENEARRKREEERRRKQEEERKKREEEIKNRESNCQG